MKNRGERSADLPMEKAEITTRAPQPTTAGLLVHIARRYISETLHPKQPEKIVPLPERIGSLSLSPSGTKLTATGESGNLHILEPGSGQIMRTLNGGQKAVRKICWNDGEKLMAAYKSSGHSYNHRIGVWNPETGEQVQEFADYDSDRFPRNGFSDCCFLGNDQLAIARLTSKLKPEGLIDIYDIKTGKLVDTIEPAERDSPFAVEPAMIPLIMSANSDEPTRQIDMPDSRLSAIRFPSRSFSKSSYTGKFYFMPVERVVSPNKKISLVIGRDVYSFTPEVLNICDVDQPGGIELKAQRRPRYEDQMKSITLSNNGKLAGISHNKVYVWNVASGIQHSEGDAEYKLLQDRSLAHIERERFQPEPHVYSITFLPDNSLITTGKEQVLKYWITQ